MTEENEIVEEIRRTRERLLAEHNGDLGSLITALQASSAARPASTIAEKDSSDQLNHDNVAGAKKVG